MEGHGVPEVRAGHGRHSVPEVRAGHGRARCAGGKGRAWKCTVCRR